MSATNSSSLRTRRGWIAPALLIVATVLAYANSLCAPFVYDDILAIPRNPTIRQLSALSTILGPQADGGLTVSGRPVLNLSFALNYAISGDAVWSYHVFNVLIHAGAGLLLFGIVRRTLKAWHGSPDPWDRNHGSGDPCRLALIIAGLWLLHPLQTQAITYTVQRAESLMGFFYLLTLYAFVRATEPVGQVFDLPSGRVKDPPYSTHWRIVSIAACALGMATKEVMATAPLIVLLYDRTFVGGSFRAAWQERGRFHLALASTWLLLAALLASTGLNRGGTVGVGVGLPLWAYPLTQFKAIATYVALSAWPQPLVFEYGTWWVERAGDILPYALVVLPLFIATIVGLWRLPALGFLGAWFFGILAPTSLAPGTIQMIVEHRMYLPLAAVLTAGVLTVHRCVGPRHRGFRWAALATALGLLAAQRNWDYRSHLALWFDTVAKRPDNPRAHEGVAEAYAEIGRLDDAIRHRQEAVRLLPDESTYHYNVAMTLVDAGRLEEAIRHYQLSLRLKPDEARTHNNLAIALGRAGRAADALPHYEEAIRLRPNDPQLHYNHGIALLRTGDINRAIQRYQETLRLDPGHADAHFNVAAAFVRRGRMDDALKHYTEALRLRSDDVLFRTTHAGALLVAGRANDAIAEYRQALALDPADVDAEFGLGNAFATTRQFADAIRHYESVLRRAPDHAHAHYKLGNALVDTDRVADAVPHYSAAIRLRPDDAEAHHNLGVAHARLEEWNDARRSFETALRLKPDYPEARRNLEQLRALLGR